MLFMRRVGEYEAFRLWSAPLFKNKRVTLMLSLLVTVAAVALTVYPDLNPTPALEPTADSAVASSNSAAPGSSGFFNSGYDLASHQTLSRVMLLVRENYVDPDRVKPREMFLAALDYVEKSVPEVIVEEELSNNRLTVQVGKQSRVFELGEMNQIWEVTMALRDIFRFMQNTVSELKRTQFHAISTFWRHFSRSFHNFGNRKPAL